MLGNSVSRNNNSKSPKMGSKNSLDNVDEVNVGETVADAIEHNAFSWQHGSLFDLVVYWKSRSTSRASRILVHVVLYQPHPDGFAPEVIPRSCSPAVHSPIRPGRHLLSADYVRVSWFEKPRLT